MSFHHRFAALGIALVLGGCVAVDLSQLNTRYDVLIQRKTALPPAPASTTIDISYSQQNEDIEAGFKSLAADATKAAGDATQPATKIVALRLAAVAAWQAKDDATFATAQAAGTTACSQLAQGTVGAPRDCAILAFLPILRAYEQTAAKSNALAVREGNNDMTVLPESTSLLSDLRALHDSELQVLPPIINGEGPYAGISPTTLGYFGKVALASACLAEAHYRNVSGMRPDTPEKKAFTDSARTVTQSYSTVLHAAAVLTADNPDWYAQPGACPKNIR